MSTSSAKTAQKMAIRPSSSMDNRAAPQTSQSTHNRVNNAQSPAVHKPSATPNAQSSSSAPNKTSGSVTNRPPTSSPGNASHSAGGKKKIAAFYLNDFTDADNEHAAIIWGLGMKKLAQREDVKLDAIFIGEPRSVSIETKLVGSLFPRVLCLTKALFGKGAVADRAVAAAAQEHKARKQKLPADWAQLQQVCNKHQVTDVATLVRGDLNGTVIAKIKALPNVINALVAEAKKPYLQGGMATSFRNLTVDWTKQSDQKACVEEMGELLKWCARPAVDGPLQDSLLCAGLTLLDYIESMMHFGCWSDIQYYLDEEHASQIETVLNHKSHHPEYLVCRGNKFINEFDSIVNDGGLSPEVKAGRLREQLRKARDAKKQQITKPIQPLRAGTPVSTQTKVINKIKEADDVFIFGGASLSIIKDVLEACQRTPQLASKITFVGQGGTFDPKINLTHNPYNYDLNKPAANLLLRYQASAPSPLKRCLLVTTEAGKQVQYQINDLADFRPGIAGATPLKCANVGLRAATFGLDALRLGPQASIKTFNDLVLEKQGDWKAALNQSFKNGKVRSPDLCAMFAVFSKSFNNAYRDTAPANRTPPAVEIVNNAQRVTFLRNIPKPEQAGNVQKIADGRIEVWMPKMTGTEMQTCTGLAGLAQECADAMQRMAWSGGSEAGSKTAVAAPKREAASPSPAVNASKTPSRRA